MISKSFVPIISATSFMGVNAKDNFENMSPSEWDESSMNVFSDPQGSLGSRPGFTALTSASIGSATAWCGFYEFEKHASGATTQYYIGGTQDGKVYQFASSAYTQLFTGLDITESDDKRFDFFTLNNQVIIIPGAGNTPLAYAGTGSAATFATSVTADFGLEWQRYGWLHSTVDPRLMYYCTTLGDPDSAYTSFLNFDMDNQKVTGACKQGDDMIVGKYNYLYRVQYRGTTPLFKIYRIPSRIGPVNKFTMKELPDGRAVFLAPDFNFYMLDGDNVIPCGDNIKNYVKKGVNSRLKYAVSGLLPMRNQYWTSFTYVSGSTTNDRTLVMDWSRPYLDKWGKTQYPWFIYTIAANCFAEVNVSGQPLLYHGAYVGKMYKDDTGTNDDNVTFNSTYKSKRQSHGDVSLEKKYGKFQLAFDRTGDWDLTVNLVCDANAATEKIITQNLLSGIGYTSLFDVAKFDVDYFASESDADTVNDINRQGKLIQITMGADGLDEKWLVHYYSLWAKPLRRGIRTRESS